MSKLPSAFKKWTQGLAAAAQEAVSGASAPMTRKSSCPRSALFVPCSNAKALAKSLSLNCDAYIFDLEDSVSPNNKVSAREALFDFLRDDAKLQKLADRRVVVRINSPRLCPQWGFPDLDVLAPLGTKIDAIAIPKVTVDDYDIIKNNIFPGTKLWAFFETPLSVAQAKEICASHAYDVAAMGLNDLSADLCLPLTVKKEEEAIKERIGRLPLYYAMSCVINAARAYKVDVLDGVFNDTVNSQGFIREAVEAKLLGFDGKTLIHPTQIPLTHNVWCPTEAEATWASKVVRAIDASAGGVAVVDGRIVEELHARTARTMITRYELAKEEERVEQQKREEKKNKDQKDLAGDGLPKGFQAAPSQATSQVK